MNRLLSVQEWFAQKKGIPFAIQGIVKKTKNAVLCGFVECKNGDVGVRTEWIPLSVLELKECDEELILSDTVEANTIDEAIDKMMYASSEAIDKKIKRNFQCLFDRKDEEYEEDI